MRDISERERLEGDLRTQAAELAASQERSHLARELHDSVTQALFSMGLTLRTLELLLDTDPEGVSSKVAELRELQQDALAEMRTLIFELRPSSLESDGLIQALRTHATAVQRRTGLTIVVDAEPVDRLPLAMEEALYRIGQEAIHNVVKHANASSVTIRIAKDGDDRLRLTVSDDGDGFDPTEVPRGHLGLLGMRQRIDLVGGELDVESAAGKGTTIDAVVPLGDPPRPNDVGPTAPSAGFTQCSTPLNVDPMQASPRPNLPSAPRVVIVDADRRVLQSLSDLLGVSGEVDVVGRAADVRSALEEIERESRRRPRRPAPPGRRRRDGAHRRDDARLARASRRDHRLG